MKTIEAQAPQGSELFMVVQARVAGYSKAARPLLMERIDEWWSSGRGLVVLGETFVRDRN